MMVKSAVEIVGGQVLGADVKIKSIHVGILSSKVHIKGLTVANPQGFPSGNLLDIEEVSVTYDLGQVIKGNIHLPSLVLRLNEMNLIKDKNGSLNVNALKIAQQKDPNGKVPPFSIDVAILDLGTVHYWDYAKVPPGHIVYDIGVNNKTYRNIKSVEQFAALVMMESMTPTKVKNLLGFGFKTVDRVLGTVKDAGSLIKSLIKQ